MKPRKPNIKRILVYSAILSLPLYFILAWMNMLEDAYERTGSDFMGFYTFGRISQVRGYPHIYEIEEQQKLQEEIVGHPVTPIFYTHLPFIAPLAKVLVNEDYIESFKRWAVILFFLNVLNVYILANLLNISKFTRENIVILCLGAFFFDPTFSGFMNGQDTAILLTGAALWAYGLFLERDALAGVGLSLATVRPQIALFLAIPFLFRRRGIFWGFVLGGSVLALISLALLKAEGTLRFIESIQFIEGTVWRENHALDMPTVSGIIRRNFAFVNDEPVRRLVWLCYLLGIAAFSLLWRKATKIDERHVGLLSIGAVFLAPYAHYHDLILLLIPTFCVIRLHQKMGLVHQDRYSLLPLAISWASVIGFAGSGWLKFPIVYAVMILLVYFLTRAGSLPNFLRASSP